MLDRDRHGPLDWAADQLGLSEGLRDNRPDPPTDPPVNTRRSVAPFNLSAAIKAA